MGQMPRSAERISSLVNRCFSSCQLTNSITATTTTTATIVKF